jgi:hypothetical protein
VQKKSVKEMNQRVRSQFRNRAGNLPFDLCDTL